MGNQFFENDQLAIIDKPHLPNSQEESSSASQDLQGFMVPHSVLASSIKGKLQLSVSFAVNSPGVNNELADFLSRNLPDPVSGHSCRELH